MGLAERAQHRAALIQYFEQHVDQLDEDARRRLHANPLRILDTKNPAMQSLVEGAPQLLDFLGQDSLAHFQRVVDALAATATGSANRIARLCLLAEPPTIDRGEITDKGSINQRAVLSHRADTVAALHEGRLHHIIQPSA